MTRRSWSTSRSWSIERGAFAAELVVVVAVALAAIAAGCSSDKSSEKSSDRSSDKTVTLPENPPAVLRPVDYDTVYASSSEEVDEGPDMKGGLKAVSQRMDYPDVLQDTTLQDAEAQKSVGVQFVVSPDGQATNIELVKRGHPDLEREVRRAVMALSFKPGRLNGTPVPVRMKFQTGSVQK